MLLLKVFCSAVFLLAISSSHLMAADPPFRCATPKTSVDPSTHNLIQRFIDVYGKPDSGARPIWLKLSAPMALLVLSSSGNFSQIAGTPDSPLKEGQPIGWVKTVDLQAQDLRNCN